jgi:hypothetical protein
MVGALLLTVLAVREAPSGLLPGLPTTPWGQAAGERPDADVSTGRVVDSAARAEALSDLGRARRAGSVEGVLAAADRLVALGDREGAERAVRIAENLAAGDPEASADVRAFASRIAPEIGRSIQ